MPAIIAGYITSPFLFISLWILGGLIALLGASIYAELGTRFPIAGGPFVIAQKTFGDATGFVTGWMDWIQWAASISFIAIALVEFLNSLIKTNLPVGIISSIIIILLAVIQWQGMRLSSNFQKIMSILKALGLLMLVMACFAYFFKGYKYPIIATVNSSSSLPLLPAIILSLRAIFITYSGWNCAIYFNEEDINPEKNLPRSLIWGVLSVMIIFVLVNLGLVAVLPLSVMAKSTLPAADAAQLIFGGIGGIIVILISIIALIGSLNAALLFTPRILFAISRSGLFFKSASMLNKHSIPGNALILTTFVSVLFALTGLFNLVVNITASLALIVDLLIYLAILFVRKQNPSLVPPFKAWAHPFSAIVMIIIMLSLIIGLFIEDTINSFYAIIVITIAIPFYFVFKQRSGKSKTAVNEKT